MSKTSGGSLPVGDLARILDDASLFASRSTDIPVLNVVHLESTSGQLIAVATDRFTLGAAMAKYLDDAPGAAFTLSLKLGQAQILSRIAKSCKTAFSNVAISVADDSVTFSFTSGESLTLPAITGATDFPKWRPLIEACVGTKDTDLVRVVGYNPGYLAKFSRVTGANRLVIKFSGAAKPALVSVTDQFVGLIMPVRIPSEGPDAWSAPDWLKPAKPAAAEPKSTPKRRAPAKTKRAS